MDSNIAQVDVPEKIWANCEQDDELEWFIEFLSDTPWSGEDPGIQYIRADIAEAENAALRAEVQRCHERLEITHVWKVDTEADIPEGEDFPLVKVDVPENERPTAIDGITCRDATIDLQKEQIAALRAQLAAAREVKPLEWDGDFAYTRLGVHYSIEEGNEHALVLKVHIGASSLGISVAYDIPPIEAAAQADYERRIRAALVEGGE